MSNAVDNLKEIISSVQLAGVRLSQLSASGSLPEGGIRNGAVEIAHSARVRDRSTDGFVVTATITVRFAIKGGGRKAAGRETTPLSLQAGFDLSYAVPHAKKFSATDLTRFANVNGVYNAWPYWRELVQSISVRMGLPALVLPVFRVPRIEQSGRGAKRAPQPKKLDAPKKGASETHGPTL